MALPFSVNTNYTPGSPVLSADLNAIQSCIVAGKFGLIEEVHPPSLSIAGPWTAPSIVGGPLIASAVGGGSGATHFKMKAGQRIQSLNVVRKGNTTASVLYTVNYVTAAQVVTSLGATNDPTPAVVWASFLCTITPHVFAAGEYLQLVFSSPAQTGYSIGQFRIGTDNP